MRRLVYAVAVVVCAALLAACESRPIEHTAAPTPTPTGTPVWTVTHSGDAWRTTSYHAESTASSDWREVNENDPAHRLSAYQVFKPDGSLVVATRIVADDIYILEAPPPWHHFDGRRLSADSRLRNAGRLPLLEMLLAGVSEASMSRPGHFIGTIDLDRAAAATTDQAAKAAADNLSRLFKSPLLPFTAILDDQGRLTRLQYAAPGDDSTFEISHYGEPVTVSAPPPADTREASADMYNSFA